MQEIGKGECRPRVGGVDADDENRFGFSPSDPDPFTRFLGFAGHSPGWSPGLLFSKGVNSGRGACDQSLASIFSRVFQLRAVTTALKRFSRYAYERVIALTPSGVQTYASVPSIEMTSGL